MPETEEEKQKRWAKSRAMSYMTPSMAHAMAMSKYQSQNKYKEQFNKTRGKGYTAVTSTPELEHVRQQSVRLSQNKYKSEFEKNKAKFTAVADDPETLRVKRVTNQVSKVAYAGRGPAMAESRSRRNRQTTPADEQVSKPVIPDPTETADEVPTSYGRPLEVEETIEEESESTAKENGSSSNQEENVESSSADQEESQGYTDEASGGYGDNYDQEEPQNEEEAPQENGNSYGDQRNYQTQDNTEYEDQDNPEEQQEAGREYREADADEAEFKEYTEGGLDDFYANLG